MAERPVDIDISLLANSSPLNEPLSPASSELSDVPPPTKKRRISESSLSDDDDDDDDDEEEDKPLAARMTTKSAPDGSRPSKTTIGKRSGKKASSMKSKAQTAPVSIQPPTGREQDEMNGKTNGINGRDTKIKVEEKMDASQLNRLATGVTVDAGGTTHAVVRQFLSSSVPYDLTSDHSTLSRLRKPQPSNYVKA